MQFLLDNKSQSTSVQEDRKTNYRPSHIFVIQLLDGRYVIGQGNNACKRIAAINSGLNPNIRKSLQVSRIIGIKPQDEGRSFIGTVNHFIDKYGADRVVAV